MSIKKIMLVILDGFGLRDEKDSNAIAGATTPYLDYIMANYPNSAISASGRDVGLPDGQFGNSEVGHINIGAGRVVRQDISKIDHEIETGEFMSNSVFISNLAKLNNNLHIFGLLSDGGVHSHIDHILELIKLAVKYNKITSIWLHMFMDGRDTPPQSGVKYIAELEGFISQYPTVRIATVCGRYYAMDRDKRYDRVKISYDAISGAVGAKLGTNSLDDAIKNSYNAKINDEFVLPIINNQYNGVLAGDGVIYANFRSDRALELTEAFRADNFSGFERTKHKLQFFITMTAYSNNVDDVVVAYPKENIKQTLGECFADAKLCQLRIAETEKYPHITYFFNGGRHEVFAGEDRILVDSPKDVATYDLKPEMSLPIVADKLCEAIVSNKYDLIVTNFANGDMVGHSGSYVASVAAVEALDLALSQVIPVMLKHHGEIVIIADHGNCEQMYDYVANQPHTQHTTNQVPFIYVGSLNVQIVSGGVLADVAPTLLELAGLPTPNGMTGKNLLIKN